MNALSEPGHVTLVGAGPGDPDLLTIKALRALESADVVLHDHLVSPAILGLVPPHVRLVDVGKIPGGRQTSQDVTNRLLEKEARAGLAVVRLKGGDPFVFGRGGEEALWLRARGVSVTVVPGISSCVAVPAAAGIPVTHRGVSTHVSIVTGRGATADGRPLEQAWRDLARAGGTLVVLMGLGRLPAILEAVRDAGRAGDTPAAVVCSGTTETQRTVVGTVADLAQRVEVAGLRPPGVVVIGDVVRLRDGIADLVDAAQVGALTA